MSPFPRPSMIEVLLFIAVILILCLHVAISLYILFFVRRLFRVLSAELAAPGRSSMAFIWDTVNLAAVLEPRVPLRRPGGWAASADLLVEIATRVIEERPGLVVELGSGLSTIVAAL